MKLFLNKYLSRYLRAALKGVAVAALAASPSAAFAGLVNFNFTRTDSLAITVSPNDGTGALGGGFWTRISDTEAIYQNGAVTNANTYSPVTVQKTAGPRVWVAFFDPREANGNPVQNEAWYDANNFRPNTVPITLTFRGLFPNHYYNVAVYTDKVGNGGASETFTVNGIIKTLPNTGATITALPGVEDVDYALFRVLSDASGFITVTSVVIAGVQIQGVLPGELGPQADLRIGKASNLMSGRGRRSYEYPAGALKQTLTQRGRSKNYYVSVTNDGTDLDNFFVMGDWEASTKPRITDRLTGANITAKVKTKDYRLQLDPGETRGLKVRIVNRLQKYETVRITGSPSTRKTSRQDVVDCVLAPNGNGGLPNLNASPAKNGVPGMNASPSSNGVPNLNASPSSDGLPGQFF